jgi:hypothetical protein
MSLAIYLVGLLLIGAVSWAAASPFFARTEGAPEEEESTLHERLRRQKDEALAGIRDAEFDRELGKLSEDDYRDLRERLEAEALAAMTELERRDHGNAR